MSDRKTWPDTRSITFSPVSADGRTPWPLPDGTLVDPLQLAHVLANLSHRQAKELGLQTSGIYGPRSSTSSGSASFQSFLANRLQNALASRGSTLYRLTWKQQATPSGRLICALRASGLRTSGKGCIGWASPTVADANRGTWTPRPRDETYGVPLSQQAGLMAGWATPAVRDYRDTGDLNKSQFRTDGKERADTVPRMAWMAGWASPTVQDASRGVAPPRPWDTGVPLSQQIGQIAIGSNVKRGSCDRLNAAHPRWLQGYPASWDVSAIQAHRCTLRKLALRASKATETRLSQRSRQPSSNQRD